LPIWKPFTVAIDVFITEANGQPGRRVAADSAETVSVKYYLPFLVGSEEFFHLAPGPRRILGPPSGVYRQIYRVLNVLPLVFPLLPCIHEKERSGILEKLSFDCLREPIVSLPGLFLHLSQGLSLRLSGSMGST
jgi:hypothetical protein